MGNANYRQTTGNQYLTVDQRNYFQTDLPKFIYQSKIGNGKFMKTYIMRVDSAPVVVKVYMKLSDEDLLVPAANLTFIWKTLSPAKYPNLLPYQVWIKSASSARIKSPASPVYLIRQYFSANLYDRLSTRPFLNEVEKLWVVFQLFKCLEICHEHGVVHGDLKPENIMCTTSNWIVLTDFSPFKPATIPDDDPTDFQYYFDCMGRHRCYLAPERFYHKSVGTTVPSSDGSQAETSASSVAENFRSRLGSRFGAGRRQGTNQQQQPPAQSGFRSSALTPAMDVFSLGCLAAEVLLDGVPLLDLPGMLRYLSMDAGASTGAGVEGSASAAKVLLSRLDQEDSPARALLMRISNVHLRNVSFCNC
jgi:phosphoinositide-3-kinase regulatory subunit 4